MSNYIKYLSLSMLLLITHTSFSMPVLQDSNKQYIEQAFNNGMKSDIAKTIQAIINLGNGLEDKENNSLLKGLQGFLNELIVNDVNRLECLELFWCLLTTLVQNNEFKKLSFNATNDCEIDDTNFDSSLEDTCYLEEQAKIALEQYMITIAKYIKTTAHIELMTNLNNDQVIRFLRTYKNLEHAKLLYVETWFFLLYAFKLLPEL